ncbi:MAG TPA: TraB/GumN family protein [Cellvibrionaceae bacterium]|nr:TraB/GumN family protein [Cellvibrionaceae bacterium]HMW48567.1 TraB/GumN family protein [Cellvibrionaceae bacterium]HMW71967.1 TraB/GumN family protein [Cellvibrionaceae bacterium]HMY37930.1 TraB/GumN family protein [Marinagarivorans sp.]HNG58248.1 TraB/GumN family protein [Cellvibrionaceae bacterium]
MGRFLVGILTLLCLMPPTAAAATSLFVVTRSDQPGHSLLLGGSIHLLRQTDFPLPPEFTAALSQANQLVLESDVSSTQQAQLGARMLSLSQLEAGKTLADLLSPALWQRLSAYCQKANLPLEQLQQSKPFFFSMMLTVTHLQRLGFVPGVDYYLDEQARKSGKPVGQLESAEEILAMMKAVDNLKPDDIIKSTLDDMDRIEPMLAGVLKAWREGDLGVIQKEMVAPMQEQMPLLYKLVLVERNQRWLPQIERLFTSPGVELVVVGSAHLTGPDGLISQLIARGYRVSAWTAPAPKVIQPASSLRQAAQ